MVLTVGLALVLMQAVTVACGTVNDREQITEAAKRRAGAALDMLEAVHVNAMLNRKQTEDGDAAIATLNGAMDQFSEASHGVDLWVVMGPKVLAYQAQNHEQEIEGPHDDVDMVAIATARTQNALVGKTLRVSRPIVLGEGHAKDARCAECHTALMKITPGEVVGSYSAAVDLRPELAAWRASLTKQTAMLLIVTLLTLVVIWVVLRVVAFRPLRDLANVTRRLASGQTELSVDLGRRSDELGLMARSLDVFRDSMIATRRLEREKENVLHSLQVSETRFRDIAEAASDWLWETDDTLRLTYLSERFASLTGRDPATVLGKLHGDVLVAADEPGQPNGFESLLREQKPFRNLRCEYTDAGGNVRVCDLAGRPLFSKDGAFQGYRGTATDITAQTQAQHLALHDALTGLPNRLLFAERLSQVVETVSLRGELAAVLCLDLDYFKEVNDTLGHAGGDALLREVATRLRENVRETDTVARLGGDEFAMIQRGPLEPADAEELCRRLIARIAEPFRIDDQDVAVGLSIGVALAPHDGDEVSTILKNADVALYRAKSEGRGTYRFFAPEMDEELQARKAIEKDLRRALALGQIELHYQPLVQVAESRITGVEALMRWTHPERGAISPAEFIPIAESTGLILPLGEWALRTACAQAAEWADVSMSVNLSPVQFRHPDLIGLVRRILRETGLAPDRLELEVTEGVLLVDTEAALDTLQGLKAIGVRIAMDDFGTGYSSLSYLHRFSFDKLKIDQSFVRILGKDMSAAPIVKAILSLGKNLGLKTTAEGVETLQQYDFLKAEGCDQVQGYYFGRPVPAAQLDGRLRPGRQTEDSYIEPIIVLAPA